MRRLLSALLLSALLAISFPHVASAQSAVQYIGGTVDVPDQIQRGVIDALQAGQVDLTLYYAVTDWTEAGTGQYTYYVSLAGLNTNLDWTLATNARWMGSAYVWFEGGQMHGRLMERDPRNRLIAQHGLQVHILGQGDQPAQDYYYDLALQSSQDANAVENFKYDFPWLGERSMKYGILGVHANGWDGYPGYLAIDFVSTDNTPPGGADQSRIARAVADGTVEWRCRDSYSVALKTEDGVFYLHLVNTTNAFTGTTLKRGEGFAEIRSGTFSGPCGYAYDQASDTWHLHLGFQPVRMIQFENCVIDTSGGATADFTCSDGVTTDTYSPGDWITSTKDYLPGTLPGEFAPKSFWDWIVLGATSIASSIADVVLGPDSGQAPEMTGTLVQIVVVFMRIVWVLFVANFNPTIPLLVLGAIGAFETPRILVGLYRLVLKLLPGAS